MENRFVEFLIPVTVLSITIDDAREMLQIDDNENTINFLEKHLKQQLDTVDEFCINGILGLKRIISGYIVHDDVIYFAVTVAKELLTMVLDKRFQVEYSNENK